MSGNTAIVVLLTHKNISVISPISRPAVLDEPIRFSVESSVANEQHGVVQIIGLILAIGLIEDAASVEDERFMGGVDGYGDGTFVDESGLKGDRVVGRDVDVAGELCADGCVVKVAVTVRLQVAAVRFFECYAAVFDYPVVGAEVFASVLYIRIY